MKISRLSVLLVLGVVAQVACSKTEDPAKTSPSAVKATASAPAGSATVAATSASATTKAVAKPAKPSTEKKPIDKAASKAYGEGLKKGRKETLAKNYDAAIAAFDSALKAIPGDARALSERGYAKLLANKLPAAHEDFVQAEASTKDAKLLGQIHYNHGLVAEKLGHAEEAKASFVRSNTLAPSKAAAAKAGANTCTATIEIGPGKTQVVKDSLALYEALRAIHQGENKLASEAEAKTRLSSRVPSGSEANLVSYADEPEMALWDFHPTAKVPEGILVGLDSLSMRSDLPCGGEEESTSTETSGLRVIRLENSPGMRVPVCEGEKDELVDCVGDAIPVSSACGTADKEIAVVVFDVAKKALVARVHVTEANGKAPKITVEGRTLKVTGEGCSSTHEL